MARHTCHALGCSKPCPPKMFMCKDHWMRLPKKHKDAIWSAYTTGQEVSKTPSPAYFDVARAARVALADIEGVEVPPAMRRLVELTELGITTGLP